MLCHEGKHYFFVMVVRQPGQPERDYAWVVGLRNSHDKTFPAGLVAGTSVFACDNLAFSGEVNLSRKHTLFVYATCGTSRSVPSAVSASASAASTAASTPNRDAPVADRTARGLVIRAVDRAAITPMQEPDVVNEWREPTHREFRPRNQWSLFNAFTEVYKRQNPSLPLARSEALHGLCDGVVGLAN